MPGVLPDGEPVPAAGTLPDSARAGLGRRPFGIYVHVPFCTTRCGYCDFNTYTAAELGARPGTPGAPAVSPGAPAVSPGAPAGPAVESAASRPVSLATYPDLAIAEIRFA